MTAQEFKEHLTMLINRIKEDKGWDGLSWANRQALNKLDLEFEDVMKDEPNVFKL